MCYCDVNNRRIVMEEKLNLSLPEVDFNSKLVQLILQLEVLRNNAISIEKYQEET